MKMIKSNLLPEYKDNPYLLEYEILKAIERAKDKTTFENYFRFVYDTPFNYQLTGLALYQFGDYGGVPNLSLNFFHSAAFNVEILYNDLRAFAHYNGFQCEFANGNCTLTKGYAVIDIYIYSDNWQEIIEADDKELMRIWKVSTQEFLPELIEFIRKKSLLSYFP